MSSSTALLVEIASPDGSSELQLSILITIEGKSGVVNELITALPRYTIGFPPLKRVLLRHQTLSGQRPVVPTYNNHNMT